MLTLGIDIGSSSIKVSILEIENGKCVASYTSPSTEMKIISSQKGWAEQDPEIWWQNVQICLNNILGGHKMAADVVAIGITYQMHGLVCVDKGGNPLMNSIIWCDSRAVEIGERALNAIGKEKCLNRVLNSPGNFTASKLAWVKDNLPEVYSKIYKVLLPGDYIMYKLTGEFETSEGGLSEQILWDYKAKSIAGFVLDYYGISKELLPDYSKCLSIHARTNRELFEQFGIPENTPVSYKSGDQPNNAFSLNVLDPGEIAATGGTSGAVYGVTDDLRCDKLSRVNTFLHVTNSADNQRNGILLCINSIGILNAWAKRNFAPNLSYPQVNELCNTVNPGSDGVIVLPFGNGAERMLNNKYTGTNILNLDLNRHTVANVLRACQESIAFAFKYGIDIMRELGIDAKVIRAGKANLFLSPVFTATLSSIANIEIELYDTDGSQGAARGAALGAGYYKNREEAFNNLNKLESIVPDSEMNKVLTPIYDLWCNELNNKLK